MRYSKRPLDVGDQIAKLENRGLLFTDKELAEQYLNNISYYRLRAYTFPFQNNDDELADHSFLRNDIDFMDIIDLYVFDRRLRSLIFNELEKIEVAQFGGTGFNDGVGCSPSHRSQGSHLVLLRVGSSALVNTGITKLPA